MVPPAEDILRTLTYNYTASTGSARYSQTDGIILGPSGRGKISCSCFIIGNGTNINVTKNGHYYLRFTTGSSSSNRMLDINLKMTTSASGGITVTLLDVKYSFINLAANKTYTLTFDVDGFDTVFVKPRLYNMALVLGRIPYTYDDIFSPIATCLEIFNACDVDSPETSLEKEVVYAYNSTDTIAITNISRTYEYTFYIIDKPSQTYSNKQAVRYADLKKDIWGSSSI